MDSCTTLTVACHLRLQFPSSIALTTHTSDYTDHTADCTDHTPYINHGLPLPLCRVLYSVYHSPRDSILYGAHSVIIVLPCLALPCVFSCVLILARVSWIYPLPCHSDSVCTSLGLLLVYLDYLSALLCWILFADR